MSTAAYRCSVVQSFMSSAAADAKKPAAAKKRSDAVKQSKAVKKKGPVDPNNLRGIMRPVPASDTLSKFGGAPNSSCSGVLEIVWDYVKANSLQVVPVDGVLAVR
ncbi:hypothetical protein ZWY2020_001309 [Hordeum vulgare]|nr:hypothetical protein ZWY2020_001309 [Hordeum vulgare]